MTFAGFPCGLELVGQDVLLAPDHLRIEAGRIDRLRIGGGDVHRDHAAEALELVGLPVDSSATMTPILPRPSATELCT